MLDGFMVWRMLIEASRKSHIPLVAYAVDREPVAGNAFDDTLGVEIYGFHRFTCD